MIATITNTDPEAAIETMIHELAYERVKHSYLFNVLANAEVDAKADELAARLRSACEDWIFNEVNAAIEGNDEQ